MAAAPPASTPAPKIQLTEAEANIATVLRHTCEWISSSHAPRLLTVPDPANPKGPPIEVINESTYAQIQKIGGGKVEARIAGGWVRDKLLSKDSHDLDVTLSSLTGFPFAHLLSAYLSSPQFASSDLAQRIAASSGSSAAPVTSSIAKIAANPEQSKNLETATARVFGLDLDFVNLRKEVYDGDTRIPVMSFGTAEEDAVRRDITINSMFYNVHTEEVEDLTRMGLRDLADGIIRTPLPANQTFFDDPLRLLRCIRFAARFNYAVDLEIVQCFLPPFLRDRALFTEDKRVFGPLEEPEETDIINDDAEIERARIEFRHGFLDKVSRERFGIEVDKMIRGPDPLRAIILVIALQRYADVFNPQPGNEKSRFVCFEIDTTSPALNPHPRNVESAALLTSGLIPPEAQVSTPVPESPVVAFKAASLLQDVWDHAKGTAASGQSEADSNVRETGSTENGDVEMESTVAPKTPDDVITELVQALAHYPRTPASRRWVAALPQPMVEVLLDAEQRARLFLGAAVLPLEGLAVIERVGGASSKKVKLLWAGETAIANGLKLGNKQAKEPALALHRARALLSSVISRREEFISASANASAASELELPNGIWPDVEVSENAQERMAAKIGLLLRQPSLTSSALHLNPATALLFTLVHALILSPGDDQHKERIVKDHVWLWEQFSHDGLLNRAEEKPVLDGNRIKTTLGFQPGPLTPRIQTAVLAWQYCRKAPVSADECAAWLKEQWDQGGIVPVEARQSASSAGGKKKARPAGGDGREGKRQKSEER
ncbi:CCA tRNA nucleotidyltransferase, mitochondrial [Tilletia horrida]|uniref:CCA tRNA nucleotidyltransferase, mitochondrial n=1 Tax=Tilletia horrida TaxID=155126 RepID=A0AAN6GWZ4_9BASI|nr:CCA tRNA nucleotidyltransferase, mitochondrial [Tilletia horrida]KAK0569562.1 CCA tRNA nucleotidyltransferase, mitochondrial [Tilletia horrida]